MVRFLYRVKINYIYYGKVSTIPKDSSILWVTINPDGVKKEEAELAKSHECCGSLPAIEDALYAIGGKWKLRITLVLIEEGAKRFNELQRTLKNISPRVLSHELKELELNGFVKRNVYSAATPVVVEYEATEYSLTLGKVLGALVEWGKMHREKVKEVPATA